MKKKMICKKITIVFTVLMLMIAPCNVHVKALEMAPKMDESGTYLIESSQDMSWFVDYVNAGNLNANAKLLSDITYTNADSIGSVNKITKDWQNGWSITDVVAYTGTFDGNGFTISGIQNKSLFDAIDGATIKNLTIADSNRAIVNYMVSGNLYKCINASSLITDIKGNGPSNRYVGGIVDIVGSSTHNGELETKQSLILSCINYANIQAPWNVGGIAGVARGENIIIDSCFNFGNFNLSTGRFCGGITSYIDGHVQIKNCFDQAIRTNVFNNAGNYGIANILNQNSTISNSYYVNGFGNSGSSKVNKLTQEIIDSINNADGYQGFDKVMIELDEDGKPTFKKQITKEFFDYSLQDKIFDTQEQGINVSIKSGISGIGDMSISYWQVQKDGSSIKMDNIPSQVGTYIVKVSVTEGTTYAKIKDLSLGEYTISYLDTPSDPYRISGDKGKGEWYNSDVLITPPSGYTISTQMNNFQNTLMLKESYQSNIYLKNSAGKITDKIPLNIKIDKEAPTVKIKINNSIHSVFESFINKITFGYFYREKKEVTIEAMDTNGIASIQYYVADKDLFAEDKQYTKEEIEAKVSSWTTYTNPFELKSNSKNVIYARVEDKAGNIAYINSEGIVIYTDSELKTDTAEQKITVIKDVNIPIDFHGNKISQIKDGEKVLVEDTDYQQSDHNLVLKESYIKDLKQKDYTLTITYSPLGEKFKERDGNDVPTSTTYKLIVLKELKSTDFSFKAPQNLQYDGNKKEASIVSNIDSKLDEKITITYYDENHIKLDSAPTTIGKYYVKINLADNNKYYTQQDLIDASWTFTIEKAQPTLVEPSDCTAFYKESLADIQLDSDNGIWKWKDPSKVLNTIGEYAYTAIFTPNDIINYDWSKIDGWDDETKTIEMDINVRVDVDTSSWGKEIIYQGIKNYVSSDHVLSAEISGNQKTWIKGNNNGIDCWFALDNSSGEFAQGSRFWLRLIQSETDTELWKSTYALIDEPYKQQIDSHKVWLFQIGVTDPDGNEYSIFDKDVPLYMQVDQSWDLENIQAIFIKDEKDECITTSLYQDMISPEGYSDFIELTLSHFSSYAIYNTIEIEEDDVLQKPNDKVDTGDVHDKMNLYVYGFMIVSSVFVMLVVMKKKKTCRKI